MICPHCDGEFYIYINPSASSNGVTWFYVVVYGRMPSGSEG